MTTEVKRTETAQTTLTVYRYGARHGGFGRHVTWGWGFTAFYEPERGARHTTTQGFATKAEAHAAGLAWLAEQETR